MRGVVFNAPHDVSVEDVPDPQEWMDGRDRLTRAPHGIDDDLD